MKRPPSFFIIAAALLMAWTAPAFADSVTLKSGEVLSGTIISETDKEVVINVKVGAGITDERSIAKEEVQKVSKIGADALEYRKLKSYNVSANSLSSETYRALIAPLDQFLKQYPASSYAAEIKANADALKQEQARVDKKEVKWKNRWYVGEEIRKNQYQLAAQALLTTLRDQSARYDTVGALNTFDQIERLYPGSEAYPDAAELAVGLMRRLEGEITRAERKAKFDEQQFNSGVVLNAEPMKTQMLTARRRQIADAEARVNASNAKWKPLLPITDKSTQALRSTLGPELQRLSQIQLGSLRKSIALVQNANESLAAKNIPDAEARLKEAQMLWPRNEGVTQLTAAIAAQKTELASAAAKQALKASHKQAAPQPPARTAPTGGGNTPASSNSQK